MRKSGPGTLVLNSDAQHVFDSLGISGTVDLQKGRIKSRLLGINGIKTPATLILPKNSTDSISLIYELGLAGLGYKVTSGSPESDQAILRLSGNTKIHIPRLTISGYGTIDFAGGEVGLANILWIESLSLPQSPYQLYVDGNDSRLFIRNWYQYEDYLLISRSWFNGRTKAQQDQLLSQIIFDGYQDFPVLAIDYDANYYQITPFHSPEPSTYGAILGGVGIGLAAWQRRRRAAKANALVANEPAAK